MEKDEFKAAVQNVEVLQKRADGSLGGVSEDDWIVKPAMQANLRELMEGLLGCIGK